MKGADAEHQLQVAEPQLQIGPLGTRATATGRRTTGSV
jgi:hypothetical protein